VRWPYIIYSHGVGVAWRGVEVCTLHGALRSRAAFRVTPARRKSTLGYEVHPPSTEQLSWVEWFPCSFRLVDAVSLGTVLFMCHVRGRRGDSGKRDGLAMHFLPLTWFYRHIVPVHTRTHAHKPKSAYKLITDLKTYVVHFVQRKRVMRLGSHPHGYNFNAVTFVDFMPALSLHDNVVWFGHSWRGLACVWAVRSGRRARR
jgi:hypothetical protein